MLYLRHKEGGKKRTLKIERIRKMFNIQKASFAQLRKKYQKTVKVNNDLRHLDQFSALQYDIANELDKRQRSAIFKYCTQSGCLRNPYKLNYFYLCSEFSNKCLDDVNRFCDDDHYEIGGFYCKNNHPHVVWF